MSAQAYPAVSPYPANGGTPPTTTPAPGSSSAPPGPPPQSAPSGPPASGPGSGFPARSGLAGIQPHGQAQSPYMGNMGSNSYGGMQPGSGAGLRGGLPEEKNVAQVVSEHTNVYARKFQILLDKSTPHTMERWLFTFGIFLLFGLNVVLRQGWYIVCYALAIYILNLFLAFLQPRFDPSVQDDLAADEVEEGAPGLPGSEPKSAGGIKGLLSGFRQDGDEEFRPFIRRLPEFKFWYSATRACVLALFSTVTRATDLPVYWPILLVYFLLLFALTMRRQIEHMIKYKYIPFDLGRKARYAGKK